MRQSSFLITLANVHGASSLLSPRAVFKRAQLTAFSVDTRFTFNELPYRGADLNITSSFDGGDNDFADRLDNSVEFLKANDFNSAWLTVPVAHAAMVARASDLGFRVHHASASDQTIVLKKWLRTTEDKVPPFANHQVGCAGFVLSDSNEILVIKEWSGPHSQRVQSQQWKLPGGLLDKGESFGMAACREVYEETGVECDFEDILTLWNRHGLTFGVSDIYVVCLLRPRVGGTPSSSTQCGSDDKSNNDRRPVINIDPVEVSAARWMPIEEFVQTQSHPLIRRILETSFGIELPALDKLLPQTDDDKNVDDNDSQAGEFQHCNKKFVPDGYTRLRPRAVLREFPVTFSSRPSILTYVSVVTEDEDVPQK